MTKMRSWCGLLAALGLAVSGTLTGVTGQAVAATHAASRAAAVPSCTASALNVHKGRLEGAAGSRFQTVRVTNESAQPCATPGWTRYRFVRNGHAIGWRSTANPGQRPGRPPVVIGAGRTVKSVLSWVDPGPVPAEEQPVPSEGLTTSPAGDLPVRERAAHVRTRGSRCP